MICELRRISKFDRHYIFVLIKRGGPSDENVFNNRFKEMIIGFERKLTVDH